jgi:2'-5' RNA ligase
MGGVAGARWQRDDQLHLTLRFIGEVDPSAVDDIISALSSVRHKPVELSFSDFGTFQRKERVDTLWLGVKPVEILTLLHRKIDRSLVQIGLAPEHRAYVPHVTIARFGRNISDLAAFLETGASFSCPAFTLDSFHLYASFTGKDGSVYEPVQSFRLDA